MYKNDDMTWDFTTQGTVKGIQNVCVYFKGYVRSLYICVLDIGTSIT